LIAESVCKLLNVDFEYDYKMIYLGKQYKQTIIEFVPDILTDLPEMNPLVVRMDLFFNEKNLLPVFNKNKCIIVTDKPIDIDLVKAYKDKIIKIVCRLNTNKKQEVSALKQFVSSLGRIPVDLEVLTRTTGENLQDLKMEFLDVAPIKSENILKKEDIKQLNGVDINSLFYLPNKFTLSKNKIYDSEYSWKINRPAEKLSKKLTKVESSASDLFWEESEFFSFLVKKNLDPEPNKA